MTKTVGDHNWPSPLWQAMLDRDLDELTFIDMVYQGSDIHSERLSEIEASSALSVA